METMRNWIKRHKKKIIVSAGVVGVGYICYRTFKAHYQDSELRAAFFQQQALSDLHIENQLQLHFEKTQDICDTFSLPVILPHLKDELLHHLNSSQLTNKLAQGRLVLSTREKSELWQELKILSFTQAFSSIWALILLVLFVRVQLNILARHIYAEVSRDISTLESVEQIRGLPQNIQTNYLVFAGFLPLRGLELLIADAKTAVEHILASKSLKEPCTFQDLRDIFQTVSNSFEKNQPRWLDYLLPANNIFPDDLWTTRLASELVGQIAHLDNENNVESLLEETRVILESTEFRDVLTSSFHAISDTMMEEFAGLYEDRDTATLPLVKLLPYVSKVEEPLLGDNRFVKLLADLPQVQSFCATVYSTGT